MEDVTGIGQYKAKPQLYKKGIYMNKHSEEMIEILEEEIEHLEKHKKKLVREPFNRIGAIGNFGYDYERIGVAYFAGPENVIEGKKAFYQLREEARINGIQDMTLDEINSEISAYRSGE